jgi:hypothetical protein
MVNVIVEYARSAFKHPVSEADIGNAILTAVYNEIQDTDKDKHLLLGFDRALNLLEIVYNQIDDHTINVFHAMKCRNGYLAKIKE